MDTIKRQIEDSCDFLARFVGGERGFTEGDVLAGIGRLRALYGQSNSDIDRGVAMDWVRRCCEKLGRKDEHYKWACGG